MTTGLREARAEDATAISALVQASFLLHVAPDWQPSARRTFFENTEADRIASLLSEAAAGFVSERHGRLLGVILLPRPTLVQLFFVAPGHLRQGIGRALWTAVRSRLEQQHPEVKTVELNAAPQAVAAYQALGFFPISRPFERHGAVATRMACWLPGQALEEAVAR